MKAIKGNTYPVKDQIKALGGKWDAKAKAWMVPDRKAEEAMALVASATARLYTPDPFSGYGRHRGGVALDEQCEICGRNMYTCGHCVGW